MYNIFIKLSKNIYKKYSKYSVLVFSDNLYVRDRQVNNMSIRFVDSLYPQVYLITHYYYNLVYKKNIL